MKHLFVASSIGLTVACAATTMQAAETIYTNANIYTVNSEQPRAEAMAVENGQIAAIGDISDVEAFKTDDTKMIDLGGRFVMPGFISSHFHPGVAGLMSTGAQLVGINDPEEILNAVRQFAADNPGNGAILGFGWSPSTFAPNGPQATFLDRAVSDRPVYLIASDAHSAWVNSKGLELLNITPDTPDPIPGVHYYKKDADGNATGWLVEAKRVLARAQSTGARHQGAVHGRAPEFSAQSSDARHHFGLRRRSADGRRKLCCSVA